jgi:hypothetical protein
MDTTPAKPAPPAPVAPVVDRAIAPGPRDTGRSRVIIYQHSPLFYWWPVWLFAFIFAAVTAMSGHKMAIVPHGTLPIEKRLVDIDGKQQERFVLVFDEKYKLATDEEGKATIGQPRFLVAPYKSLGTAFLFILLIVIFITNIQLRGLWSFAIAGSVIMLAIIFELAGWWAIIFDRLGHLSIFINLGGYLLLAITVLGLWLITFLFLDRQMYIEFGPGQVKMRLEIGGGVNIYSSRGTVVEKQRTDVFRHWILGFGSGDLIIHINGVPQPILVYNILNCDANLKRIQRLVAEQVVVSDAPSHPVIPAKP